MAERKLELSLALSSAAGLATSVLIARAGGPAVRGEVTTVAVWAQLAGWIACFSMDKAIVDAARNSGSKLRQLVKFSLRTVLLASIPLMITAALALLHILDAWALSLLAATIVLATALLELTQGVFLAARRLDAYAFGRTLQPLAYALGATFIWLLFASGLASGSAQSVHFVGVLTASVCVASAWSGGKAQPLLEPSNNEQLSLVQRREMVSFATRTQFGAALQYLNSRLDLLVLPVVASASTVGAYAVAAATGQLIALGGGAGFVRQFSSGAQRRDWTGLAGATVLASVIAVTAQWTVPAIFGPGFEPAVGFTRILVFGGVAAFGAQAANGALLAAGRPTSVSSSQGLAVVVLAAGLAADQGPTFVAICSAGSHLLAWVAAEMFLHTSRPRNRQ